MSHDPDTQRLRAALARAVGAQNSGRFAEAMEAYDLALSLSQNSIDALNGKGSLLGQLGHLEQAILFFDRALAVGGANPVLHFNKAFALHNLGRFPEALGEYDSALGLSPDYPEALNNRGLTLHALNRFEEAITHFDRALRLRPNFSVALNNKGSSLTELRRLTEALDCFDQALVLNPNYAIALNNRAGVLAELGHFQQALAAFDRTIHLAPDYRQPRVNRSLTQLLLGNFEQGWQGYEWRDGGLYGAEQRASSMARWDGTQELLDKSVLVHAEQGLGDTIQFCRYVTTLRNLGARVVLEVPPQLRALLETLDGVQQFVSQGAALPECDFQIPLLSLPLATRTTLATIPGSTPYLQPEPLRVEKWASSLRRDLAEPRPLIGIAWRGNTLTGHSDQGRFVPPKHFGDLSKATNARFISLQKDAREDELTVLRECASVDELGADFDAGPQAFLDTAAVMANLDLVITIDNSIAHLAGALARPVWVLLKHIPDWRWMLGRSDSPWYPTARLFRQSEFDRWDTAIQVMSRALKDDFPWTR
jgi:tetratricopeptide (TPR) repeat protein